MKTPLTTNQVRGFWAAWAGWALDGMDSFIYALVLTPAIRELLPRSGIEATNDNVVSYGSVLFALFLFGWGLSMIWGPVADRFGRVRTLALTILCYSVFTLLSAFAASVWQLAAFRLLAGVGIGGEWAMGGTFVAEEWPEDRRKMGAGYLHTGYYFGFFLAAIANYFIGARYGWRWMFAVGGTPALLVTFIQYGVHESKAWKEKLETVRPSMTAAFAKLFSTHYARRTWLNSLYLLVSVVGLWAGSVYVPTSVTQIAMREGRTAADAARLASYGTMVLSVGTILGCLALPRTRGTVRPAADARLLFRRDVPLGVARVRLRLLLRVERPVLVLRRAVFPRHRRRQLRDVYALAAGAVLDRVPRQRLCLHHVGRDDSSARGLPFWSAQGWPISTPSAPRSR